MPCQILSIPSPVGFAAAAFITRPLGFFVDSATAAPSNFADYRTRNGKTDHPCACGKLVEYLLREPLRNLKTNARPCITAGTKLVSDAASNPRLQSRRWRIFAAAVLIAALGVVVIYTSQRAFLSPVALVVVAAIGFAAVLMQLRLRQGPTPSGRALLWLNVLGIIFALAAVFADVLRLNPSLTLVTALGAVLCFATSGAVVLAAMRKQRT
jgi:uncharacterized membrane protein HdeD (DUF308 family)